MICNKCGAENSDTAKFCDYCGTDLTTAEKSVLNETLPEQGVPEEQPPIQKPKKKKKLLILVLIIAAILAILCIAAALNGGEISFTTAHFKDATMASEINQLTAKPVVRTNVFSQAASVIYVTAYVKNVPPNTQVSAIWTYIPSGEVLNGNPVTLKGDAQIQFNVTMTGSFTAGDYKVDLMIDGKIKKTLKFKVE